MRLSEQLRGRTKSFAARTIKFYISLPRQRDEVSVIGRQLLRSATSVAAHAREASRARSDAEFCSKLDGLLQEADESALWLELLQESCNLVDGSLEYLLQESQELLAIFTRIVITVRQKGQ